MRRLCSLLCGVSLSLGVEHAVQAGPMAKERLRAGSPKGDQSVQLIVRREGQRQVMEIRNDLPVPVSTVLILSQRVNVQGVPDTPLHRVVPPGTRVRVATLRKRDERFPMIYRQSFSYAVDYSPEPGKAGPVAGPAYDLPWVGGPFRISQGAGGDYSHRSPMGRYAIDVAMPEGTPIIAARGGTVLAVRNTQAGHGPNAAGNFVRIRHEDGTHSAYMHLRRGSVRVKPGDRVTTGTPLAESGNTGRSTGPHLHFVVQQEVGKRLVSVPFRFSRKVGPLPNFALQPNVR